MTMDATAVHELLRLTSTPDGHKEWVFIDCTPMRCRCRPAPLELKAAVQKLHKQGCRGINNIRERIVAAHPSWEVTDSELQLALKQAITAAVQQAATATPTGFEVRSAGKAKGLGVFATRSFNVGDRIIAETPMLRWTTKNGQVSVVELERKLAKLSKEDQDLFWSLASIPLDGAATSTQALAVGPTQSIRIWMANAYPTPESTECESEGAYSGALYRLISRINHACAPNCAHGWNERTQKMTIHAVRPIAPGDEITVTYLGSERESPTRDERQTVLRAQFGFECCCELCSLPAAALAESDARRARLITFADWWNIDGQTHGGDNLSFKQLAKRLEERLMLMKAEGIPEALAHSATFCTVERAAQAGYKSAARALCKQAVEGARITLGEDNVTYMHYMKWLAALS